MSLAQALTERGGPAQSSEDKAHLMAAAPELLACCKAYLALLEETSIAHTTLSKMINELKQVIAKAEGAE